MINKINEYEYQQSSQYFAQVAEGMEELGAEELSSLNARNVTPVYRGIRFQADPATLYTVNYTSRLVSRVLAPLAVFNCHSHEYLYRTARKMAWSDFFTVDHSFAVFANVANSKIRHSQYAAQRLKDGVVDYFYEKGGRRPSVNKTDPDLWIGLHIENNRATLSLDTSGGPLHRRGYREKTLSTVMQETLAAAVVRLCSWDGSVPLYDPMCGAGTLLSEALMRYCRIPAGYLRRRFGFEFLPDFDAPLWKGIRKRTDGLIRGLPEGLIAGSDLSPRAIQISRTNLAKLPHGDKVALRASDFRDLRNMGNRIIVSDPPYGVRTEGREGLPELYKRLGDFLKKECRGSTAFIYFGDREFIKHLGLKPSRKIPLHAGGLDGRLVKYDLY
jgi:putative N6-adenine-specific DNA methylase